MKAEIEVVPCKICGDRSSGVHYGVITCEGCKGFFRRSQTAARPYECQGNQNCAVDRSNRNRCQYCRWKKCIELGMSRDAVKFGRMSKKQREKVEGEVNLHKRLNDKGRESPSVKTDSIIAAIEEALNFQHSQLPNGSVEQSLIDLAPLATSEAFLAQSALGRGTGNGCTGYNALSPVSSGYSSSHTSSPTPAGPPSGSNGSARLGTVPASETAPLISPHDSGASNTAFTSDSLTETVLAAHVHTSLYSPEQRQQLKMIPIDYATLWKYRNMSQLDWWSHGASELTPMIHQIVEFAKMIPGFTNLSQDDQILLLKGGAMDVAVIRISTLYDLNSNTILFGGVYVPTALFHSDDHTEANFIYELFMFLQELSSFNLTETEIALFSAMMLMWPHRPSLANAKAIDAICQRLAVCLETELRSRRGDYAVPLFRRLEILFGNLQRVSAQHTIILHQFLKTSPRIVLPPLYKEIFVMDH